MKCFACFATILLLMVGFPSRVLADENDPTAPSPQIAELLAADATVPAASDHQQSGPQRVMPSVKLKAMVLRDSNHGSALISVAGSEPCLVPLSRNPLGVTGFSLAIGGERFLVVDFSRSHVLLRSADTGVDLVVN